jgi:peptidoglycan/LPS O-acetylase OafA/YrhL
MEERRSVGRQNPESRNLDLLRAVAVLCVFGSHLILSLMPGHHVFDTSHNVRVALLYGVGNVGVLLFFVHTSLVLMLSLERRRRRSVFLDFYIRRFFRIYPLSIVCILIVLLLQIPWVPEVTFVEPGWRALVSNVLLVQNLTYAKDLISPLWTLPREVQMYAILPLIFVVLRRIGSVPLVLVLWWTAALAAPHASVLTCVPCFMGGVFAYQIGKEKTHLMPALLWPVSLTALLLMHLWFRHTIADDVRPDYALCMILGGLIPNFRDLTPNWLTGACHIVARYSYGIYLFHLPVIWFAFVKLRVLPVWLQWASLCILMCGIPWMAYTWLEAPLIETGRRLANRLVRREDPAPVTTVTSSASPELSQPPA